MQLLRKKVCCLFLFYWAQNVSNPDSVLSSVLLGIFTYFVRSYMWFLICKSSCQRLVLNSSVQKPHFHQFSPYNSIPLKLKRKDFSSGFYATKVWMSRDHISWHVDLQSCTARSSLLWREEAGYDVGWKQSFCEPAGKSIPTKPIYFRFSFLNCGFWDRASICRGVSTWGT